MRSCRQLSEGVRKVAGGETSLGEREPTDNRPVFRAPKGCAPVGGARSYPMASTHLSLHYHFVFSTKNREPWLAPTERRRVHEFIGGIIRSMNGIAHAVGGTGDHIHIAAGLRATHCLADVKKMPGIMYMKRLKDSGSPQVRSQIIPEVGNPFYFGK